MLNVYIWRFCVFSFTALPLLTLLPAGSAPTVDLTFAPSAYVISHKEFTQSAYEYNVHNKLTLGNPSTSFNSLIIDFTVFDIEMLGKCNASEDVFVVTSQHFQHECGFPNTSDVPSQMVLNITSAQDVSFELRSRSPIGHRGFLFKYSGMSSNILHSVCSPTSSI